MGVIEQVRVKPTLDTSWEALKDQRKIPNSLDLFSKIDPLEVVAHYLNDLASQGVDISEFSVDWPPEHPPNFMKRMREPSEKSKKAKKDKLGETSGSRPPVPLADSPKTPPSTTKTSNPPSLKFNLTTTTLLVSEAEILNETTSSSSSTPSSPLYYILSSDTEPSDPQFPTLAQLQACALASQQPPQPEPETTSPPPEQPTNPPQSEQPQPPPSEQPATPPSEQQPTIPPTQKTPPPFDIPTIPTSEDHPYSHSR
ncbi:proline-rich receptor-like protein kinase PERK2 [Lathyrus oleraceus]|uniref:proline-rich receptor-like protein kinase PERK2 n=1 Tax=Pisum sativum TaxID=3888 RepID=UPI0021CF974A|nr:proline-rich receptor-like protein kinase PERK2 [Pisum sativum]